MLQQPVPRRTPLSSLLYLIVLILAGSVVFTLLGMLIGGLIYGMDHLLRPTHPETPVGLVKILQIVASAGTFLFPAWLYARAEGPQFSSFFKLNTAFYPILIILTIAIMYSSAGVLSWAVELNRQMHLPDFLRELESWMRNQEDKMAELTHRLLSVNSPPELAVNLLMIALLPALGEELIFRGCIQKIFTRWTKNHHLGIWIAAIIFSAIHLQFYGFLPRMLLGALFGYLLVWSNNLWFPILGHFVNNATAVITAYVYQQQGKPITDLEQAGPVSAAVYWPSLFFTAVTIWMFYEYTRKRGTQYVT